MFGKRFSILFLGLVTAGLCTLSVSAITPTDCTNDKYLDDHGHSKEIVRLVNLQKARAEGSQIPETNKGNKFVRYVKNLFTESDATIPADQFGDRKINIK